MWYYAIDKQQHGPFSHEAFMQLIAAGTVRQDTLVWREGMSNWLPAGQTELAEYWAPPGMSPPVMGQSLPPISSRMPSPAEVPASRGEFAANQKVFGIMGQASDLMSGRWGIAIGFAVLFFLVLFGLQLIPYIGGLVSMVLTGALQIGAMRFWLTYTRHGDAKIDQMFSGFPQFVSGLLVYLLMSAITVVVCMIAIIPGGILLAMGMASQMGDEINALMISGIATMVVLIIVGMTYLGLIFSQVFYIMADNKDAKVFATVGLSYRLMKGNKWRLLRLWLVFTGLMLLVPFTLFIGLLWLSPYMLVCYTAFYESLLTEEMGEGSQAG